MIIDLNFSMDILKKDPAHHVHRYVILNWWNEFEEIFDLGQDIQLVFEMTLLFNKMAVDSREVPAR